MQDILEDLDKSLPQISAINTAPCLHTSVVIGVTHQKYLRSESQYLSAEVLMRNLSRGFHAHLDAQQLFQPPSGNPPANTAVLLRPEAEHAYTVYAICADAN